MFVGVRTALNAIGAFCDPSFFTVEQASILLVKLFVAQSFSRS